MYKAPTVVPSLNLYTKQGFNGNARHEKGFGDVLLPGAELNMKVLVSFNSKGLLRVCNG